MLASQVAFWRSSCDDLLVSKASKTAAIRDSAAACERYEQAMVDADIEGVARSPEVEAMIAAWDAEGVDDEEQIRRLKAWFRARSVDTDAAE